MAREISLEAKKGIVAMLRERADEAEREAYLAAGHHAQSPRTALYAERDRLRRWANEIQNIDEIGTEELCGGS